MKGGGVEQHSLNTPENFVCVICACPLIANSVAVSGEAEWAFLRGPYLNDVCIGKRTHRRIKISQSATTKCRAARETGSMPQLEILICGDVSYA